jgi:serine/threonine protein kinase
MSGLGRNSAERTVVYLFLLKTASVVPSRFPSIHQGRDMSSKREMRSNSKQSTLDIVSKLVEPRMGRLPLMGRYHKLPRRLQAEYQLTKTVLGTGCNGSVWMANSINLKNPQSFAVKTFQTKDMDAEKISHLQAEVEVFLCMDHPHVARLVDVFEAEDSISLVMECMAGGEVFDRVLKCKRFQEDDAASATKQMLLAVNYVHSHGTL